MAMFGVSGRDQYDALYDILNNPADTSAREREQAPDFFEGDALDVVGRGLKTVGGRLELGAYGLAGAPPKYGLYGIDQEMQSGAYGEKARQATEDMEASVEMRKSKLAEAIKNLRPDPKTNGMASQLLFGITDVLGTVVASGGNPYVAGGLYGYTQSRVGMAEGLDPLTAYGKGALEGAGLGLGVALAPAYGTGLASRIASAAGINAAIGIGTRAPVSLLLNSRGYSEMAQQYAPLDATSVITDLALGAVFGWSYRSPVKGKLPPPEAIPPLKKGEMLVYDINGFPIAAKLIATSENGSKIVEINGAEHLLGFEYSEESSASPDFKHESWGGKSLSEIDDQTLNDLASALKEKLNSIVQQKATNQAVFFDTYRELNSIKSELNRRSSANIPPSAIDAALTANEARHAEIDTAPGIPINTRTRQAHNEALNQAVESMVMGRGVNVENLLQEAGFIGKRPDFDALRIIADELDKAGAGDLVAQVRALEAEARSRGLVVDEDTIGSVVLSDKPVEQSVAGKPVLESQVKIGQDYVPTKLVLVEAADVQATMMKADNQFRDRTRVASEQQIADIAARLDAALLMDAPVMDYGAPVMAADGTVIGGNGRAAAVNRAYEQGTAQAYREALREKFGDAVDGMQAPMLVRVLQREVDVQKAAILSNEGGALRMSALEQAKVDAERLGDLRGVQFSDDGMADMTTIRSWVGNMPQNQRAAIMDADGRLSAEGATRLRNAVLFKAYGDSPTLARLVESTDPGSRNIAAALTRAAPAVADARESIDRGELYPMGLHDDLIGAVEKLDNLRRDGMSVDDWMKQLDAFGDGMTPEARLLVQFMDANIRSSRSISDGIFGFYNRLLEAGSPKQGSMFEAAQPDKMRMLTLALEGDAPMYGRGTGMRSNVADLQAAFRAMFGRDADRLLDAGRVKIVQSVSDLPGSGHPADVGGMFWRGEAWVVADNTGLAQIRGRVLHEVGEHAGMQDMLGDALYQQVLDTVARKAESDPVFKEALALAEARANRPEHVQAETLAYLIENAPELPVVRRVLAAVRQWLYRVTGGRFVDLTQADLQMMAAASLRRYAREAEVAARGEDAPWYMTLFHGSPTPFKPEEGAPLGRLRWRYINTGEGAQAFGYGHYLAQQEWIARTRYRDRLVKGRANSASMTIERPGHDPFTFYASDGPAYRIGDRTVHVDMLGGDSGIAWAIRELKSGSSVENVRIWAERDLSSSLERLQEQERGFVAVEIDGEWNVMNPMGEPFYRPGTGMFKGKDDAIEAAKNYNVGFYRSEGGRDMAIKRFQQEVDRAEAALKAVDEVTMPDPLRVEEDGYGGFMVYRDINGQLEEMSDSFKTRDEADAFMQVMPKRILRTDITEVKPEPPNGALYGKFIPDETWNQMLIWDAPLSKQPEGVRAAFEKMGIKEQPLPEWTVRDDGAWELEAARNILVIKNIKAPDLKTAARELGYKFKEVGPGWPAPWEITWRDGSKAYYKTEDDVRAVIEREWLLEETGMDEPVFSVYRNGELSSNEPTLEEAKKWALEFAGIRDLDGQEAYRKLSRMIRDEDAAPAELQSAIKTAVDEIVARRDGGAAAKFANDDEIASVILNQLGIPGHRFLDGETRAAGWDAPEARFNVVLYSDDLGRVAWEARNNDTEWVTANGKGRVVKRDAFYDIYIDGKQGFSYPSLDSALRKAEQELDGQLYSRGDTIKADPIEDTTMPDARLLADQADAEITTAKELSQGFLPAVECAMRVGQ